MPINCQRTVADPQPLLAYLLEVLELKRSAAKNLLKYGAVRINGQAVRQFDHPLVPGDEVAVGTLSAAAATGRLERAQIQTVYEDDSLIVVDKPTGLLTVATERELTDTLYVRLNGYLKTRNAGRGERALVVHRIDQETSGLVLFAKTEPVKRLLQAAWPTVEKVYSVVTEGRPFQDEGTISNYLYEQPTSLSVYAANHQVPGSRLATSHWRVLSSHGGLSLLEVRLGTGRKHQIRVHLANLGCPVVGDRRYGKRSTVCDRLALHASGIVLSHPVTGEKLSLTSPLPKPLRRLIS